jgi:hypothetical protein
MLDLKALLSKPDAELGVASRTMLPKLISLAEAVIRVRDLKQDCERFEENFHKADCFAELDAAEDAVEACLAALESDDAAAKES